MSVISGHSVVVAGGVCLAGTIASCLLGAPQRNKQMRRDLRACSPWRLHKQPLGFHCPRHMLVGLLSGGSSRALSRPCSASLFCLLRRAGLGTRFVDFPCPTTVVDLNGPQNAHFDLALMSGCQHFLIANSSLSWWGAWLGERAGKRVIAPNQWFLTADKDT